MRVGRRAALSVSASPCRGIGGGCKADEWIASFSLRSWDTLMAMTCVCGDETDITRRELELRGSRRSSVGGE